MLTQIRPVTHFEKHWFDLKSDTVQNYPNTATNHHPLHNTSAADVISHSLSHFVDLHSAAWKREYSGSLDWGGSDEG